MNCVIFCVKMMTVYNFFTAAMEYLKAQPVEPVNMKEFENTCGVGVKITPDQIEECVSMRNMMVF